MQLLALCTCAGSHWVVTAQALTAGEPRASVGFADGAAEADRQSEPTIIEGQEHHQRPIGLTRGLPSSVSMSNLNHGLYIILISLHGLVRGDRMELGKDPDTGGQVRQHRPQPLCSVQKLACVLPAAWTRLCCLLAALHRIHPVSSASGLLAARLTKFASLPR